MACWVCHYLTSLIFCPFGDPGWEFQIVRNLVERAPVPLLGLVLVFVGEKNLHIFKFYPGQVCSWGIVCC